MNSTTMAPKVGAVPELLVDIASISSRLFWLVRHSMSGAAAGLQLPTEVFTRFSDVVALRNAIDDTPPLLDHPQGLCRLRDEVIVDGVGPGRVNWIHPSRDVRVELARYPGSAEFYPAAAIRQAVAPGPRFEHEVVPIGLREANLVVERLHRRLGKVQGRCEGAAATIPHRQLDPVSGPWRRVVAHRAGLSAPKRAGAQREGP